MRLSPFLFPFGFLATLNITGISRSKLQRSTLEDDQNYKVFANSTGGFTGSLDGLIGLGPYSSSVIRFINGTAAADPPLDRIFRSNDTTSNYLAILLDRSDDPDEPYPGDLAIGEVLPKYEDIRTQPQCPVTSVMTQVTDTPYPNNATVVFDTGEIWTLPCDQELNATFLFAGIEFPIHPLDLNFDYGNNQCVGAFQPFSYDDTEDGMVMYDMVLGMAFLRNAYLLIDFGSFVDGAPSGTNALTYNCCQDFARVRLNNGTNVDELASHSTTTTATTTTTHQTPSCRYGDWVISALLFRFPFGHLRILCCRRRRSQHVSSTQAAWVPYAPQNT
ncbi:hypothetical protein BDR07DRAFT_1405544, partial [Suillus spraguei]